MKKNLTILIIIALFFASAALLGVKAEETDTASTAGEATSSLEKIPSPDKIKHYRNIIKKGLSLFGVKKDDAGENSSSGEGKKIGLGKKLEKIAAPQFIKLYDGIRKMGNSLWGYKKGESKKEYKVITSDISSCVISAIKAKDESVKTNNTGFSEDLNALISTRTSCQETALGTTENQETNAAACVSDFQKGFKDLKEENNKAHKEVWKTYQDALKACGGSTTSETTTSETTTSSEISVEDGGGSIAE